MGNQGRGRGQSSSRGRGQNRPSNRIRKSSSPAKPPAIVISSALDQNKLSSLCVPRSPIRTRAASNKAQQQSATASGKPQQSTQDGGAGPSSAANTDTTTTTATIPTSNAFAMLTDSEDDDKSVTQQGNNDPADEAKKAKMLKCSLPRVRDRPPMIHVVDTLCSTIDELLIPSDVQYFVKVTKVAVQILALDLKNHDKILDILKANGVKYFTYENRNHKLVKFVLQGLGDMSIAEVTAELLDYDITPCEIKVLSKKTTATGTHVLYLLYFEKGSAKLQDLRQIKCLSGYIVSWRYFTKRPTDAAQCHRCQKFGHGSRNCNLTPKCVKCGKDHLTTGCSLPSRASLQDDGNADRHKPSVKCANCGGNHTANFRGCTARKSYVEQLEKRKKTPVSRPPSSSTAQPAAGSSSANPPGWGRSYANVAAGQDTAPAPNATSGGELFSLSEFLILARDMFQRLSSCRNKQQQFLALSELMMKYVCIV